jgi:hypothetical protein
VKWRLLGIELENRDRRNAWRLRKHQNNSIGPPTDIEKHGPDVLEIYVFHSYAEEANDGPKS